MGSDLWQSLERLLHRGLRQLPITVVSDIGARLAWVKLRVIDPGVARKARVNLRRHLPQASHREIERQVWRFVANVGRLMAEFVILHRVDPAKHMQFVGAAEARADIGQVPTIALCLHLGNWEVLAAGLKSIGIAVASVAEVPTKALHREVATATRAGLDVEILSPDRDGLLRVMAILKAKGVVAFFADEKRDGNMMAPLFGRPTHTHGNLALAARLARHTKAQLIIAYCERIEKAQFRLNFHPPIRLDGRQGDTHADVAYLNSLIEPIILQHLDQWYYLDDAIEPIA